MGALGFVPRADLDAMLETEEALVEMGALEKNQATSRDIHTNNNDIDENLCGILTRR